MELLVNRKQASLLWGLNTRAGHRTGVLCFLGGFSYQDPERAGEDDTVECVNKPKK